MRQSGRTASRDYAGLRRLVGADLDRKHPLSSADSTGEIGFKTRFAEKAAAAHEHSVLAGNAPFERDPVNVLARLTGHLDRDFAGTDRTAMEQADPESADLTSHRRDRVSPARDEFGGNRQLNPFVVTQIRAVNSFDAFEYRSQVVQAGAAPGIGRIHGVSDMCCSKSEGKRTPSEVYAMIRARALMVCPENHP